MQADGHLPLSSTVVHHTARLEDKGHTEYYFELLLQPSKCTKVTRHPAGSFTCWDISIAVLSCQFYDQNNRETSKKK